MVLLGAAMTGASGLAFVAKAGAAPIAYTVHVTLQKHTEATATPGTNRIPSTFTDASTTTTGGVVEGAGFTLETGAGPSPTSLTPLTGAGSTCTTDATGKCTLTTATSGTYWVVETTVPSGDSASQPYKVAETVGTLTYTAKVTEVPLDCVSSNYFSSGFCAAAFGPGTDLTYKETKTATHSRTAGFSYTSATQTLAIRLHGKEKKTTAFKLCIATFDMSFVMLTPGADACWATGELVKTYGATLSTYSSAQSFDTTTAAKTYTIYDMTVPTQSYWFIWETCPTPTTATAVKNAGGKVSPRAISDPKATPPAVPSTISTTAGAASVTTASTITDTATVTGTATAGAPSGTVVFSVCGPEPGAAPSTCTPSASNAVGGAVALAASTSDTSTATSAPFRPTAAGTWCFSASYSPTGSRYDSSQENVTGTAVAAECFKVVAVVARATSVHTGMPWAGSRPFEIAGAGLGAGLIVFGLELRRRQRRRPAPQHS